MQSLSFGEKLALTFTVFCQTQDASVCAASDFVQSACQLGCFSHDELLLLETRLSQKTGTLRCGNTHINVVEGVLQDVVLRSRPLQVKEVTQTNWEAACDRYLLNQNVPQNAKKRVADMQQELKELAAKRDQLHRELSLLTFQILSEDMTRYNKTKERAMLLQKARRQARKCERAALPPKQPRIPKRPRKLKATPF